MINWVFPRNSGLHCSHISSPDLRIKLRICRCLSQMLFCVILHFFPEDKDNCEMANFLATTLHLCTLIFPVYGELCVAGEIAAGEKMDTVNAFVLLICF